MTDEVRHGQTCCFVGPRISYGVYQVSPTEFYVCTERAPGIWLSTVFSLNLASSKCWHPTLIGTLVHAPFSVHQDSVRVLPMELVLATKGTGVVTSILFDSPDDYATVKDLAKKTDYYKIKKGWAELEITPIRAPSYRELTAEFLVKMKINSPKDTKPLAEVKELAYKEGFYQGTMLIGDFKGEKVGRAKLQVREILLVGVLLPGLGRTRNPWHGPEKLWHKL